MPLVRISRSSHEQAELTEQIANVIRQGKPPTPDETLNEPAVFIYEQDGKAKRVVVIWNKFEGVDPELRGEAILQAFDQQERQKISVAMGLTLDEADILWPDPFYSELNRALRDMGAIKK